MVLSPLAHIARSLTEIEHISALIILHPDFRSICGSSAGSIIVNVLCWGYEMYGLPKATKTYNDLNMFSQNECFFDGELGLVDLQTVTNFGAFVFVDPSFEESYKAKKQGCQPLAAEFQKVTTKDVES